MHQPVAKSNLSAPQSRLVDLVRKINFGRIERLLVNKGVPIFEPAPRVIEKLKLGAENVPPPDADVDDFFLKRATVEMLQAIAEIGDGEVLAIEIRHGVPVAIEVERSVGRTGGSRPCEL